MLVIAAGGYPRRFRRAAVIIREAAVVCGKADHLGLVVEGEYAAHGLAEGGDGGAELTSANLCKMNVVCLLYTSDAADE